MRTVILVSAAIMALGSVTTTANAGALWIAKDKKKECYWENKGQTQASCQRNYVGYGSKNKQTFFQINLAGVPGNDIEDIDQENVGINVVKKGSYNTQHQTQANVVIGNVGHRDEVDQDNTSVNTVDHGYGNTQKVTQVNVAAGDLDGDVEQNNSSTNHVSNGNGNYQSGTQVNGLIAF